MRVRFTGWLFLVLALQSWDPVEKTAREREHFDAWKPTEALKQKIPPYSLPPSCQNDTPALDCREHTLLLVQAREKQPEGHAPPLIGSLRFSKVEAKQDTSKQETKKQTRSTSSPFKLPR